MTRRTVAFVLAWCPAAVARAQPAPLAPLIDQLGSANLQQREDATQRIPRLPGLMVADIERVLRAPGLTPEQELRLNRIAERLFASTPRAGLGVRFSVQTEDSVTLAGVVDDGNFPAAKMLRGGDTFIEVDGVSPVTQDWLKAWILSHAPGETMNITVRRDGQTVKLEVPLGSFDNLGNTATLDQASIAQAYRLRRSRLGEQARGPALVGRGLSATDWIEAAYPDHSFTTDPRPVAILSGHLVGGVPDSVNRARDWETRSLHLLHPLSLTGDGFPAVMPDDLRSDLRGRLQRQTESLDRRADQLTELIDRREFTPDELRNINDQIGAARAQADATRQQLAELEAVPEPKPTTDPSPGGD